MMARRILSSCFSASNLAEWTPITTRLLGYASSSFFSSGKMCMQLMQQYVQKSISTNLPLRSFFVSGLLLNQGSFCGNSGAGIRLVNGLMAGTTGRIPGAESGAPFAAPAGGSASLSVVAATVDPPLAGGSAAG